MDTERNHRNQPQGPIDPLWIRTKRRLDRMATFTARLTPTCVGSDERIALREERIALASRELVLLLKAWEEQKPEPWYQPGDGNKLV